MKLNIHVLFKVKKHNIITNITTVSNIFPVYKNFPFFIKKKTNFEFK